MKPQQIALPVSDMEAWYKELHSDLDTLQTHTIHLAMTGLDAWIIMQQLQLALRHPDNIGTPADVAHRIAAGLEEELATTDALSKLAGTAWHSMLDLLIADQEAT